jgi:putative DNA primase/helicase
LLILTESFFGKEDLGLIDKLLAELPGILNWSLKGWRRLQERGRFVQPASGMDAIEELEALGSPVGTFVRDWCEVGTGYSVTVDHLFTDWEIWCREGRQQAGTK